MSWGLIIGQNRNYLLDAWWTVTLPGIAIFVTVLGDQPGGRRHQRRAQPQTEETLMDPDPFRYATLKVEVDTGSARSSQVIDGVSLESLPPAKTLGRGGRVGLRQVDDRARRPWACCPIASADRWRVDPARRDEDLTDPSKPARMRAVARQCDISMIFQEPMTARSTRC